MIEIGYGCRDRIAHITGTSHSTPGRDRTCDQPLRRRLLYPLSYGGNAQVSVSNADADPTRADDARRKSP